MKKTAKKEASQFLVSNYITKLYQSKPYSIGIKTDTVQWNRMKSPEITPHTYGQLIYSKEAKNIQWRKKKASSLNGDGITGELHSKELNWAPILHHKQKLIQNGSKT